MAASNSIEPLDDYREFTDFTGDLDLIALAPYGSKVAARFIEVVDIGAGTKLLVATTSASHPTDRSYTCVQNGEKFIAKFVKVDATSTVARIRVGW